MTPAEVAELAAYAKLFNQRFGQFISNVLPYGYCNDPFHIEDDTLLEAAREYVKRYNRMESEDGA